MSVVKSPITDGYCRFYCSKNGIHYYQCNETKTIFTPVSLNQDNMVGGTGELVRNLEQNNDRSRRIKSLANNPMVLDYGCGNGYLVENMIKNEITAEGYDLYNEKFKILPNKKFDIVTMIEVIEHTCYPFYDLDKIFTLLKPNGIVYIETSFSDWVDKNHPYLNPDIGHCTIFSHLGLDILMNKKGFFPANHINNNVRLYKR